MESCRSCGKVMVGNDQSFCEPCLERAVYIRENNCVWCYKELTEETKSPEWCDPCCKECARKHAEGGIESVYMAN